MKNKTKMLVEAGVMIALSYLLSKIKLYRAPQGGSITAGSMIPLILFSLRWGVKPGMLAGLVYGTLKMSMGGYVINTVQGLLDYPLAYACLGLAGCFKEKINFDKNFDTKLFIAILFSGITRIIMHIISGIIFFSSSLPEGTSALKNSLIVNSMLLLEVGMTSLILFLIWKPIKEVVYR